jgi:hypothetical protein
MGVEYNPSIVTDGLLLCLDAGNAKSYSGSGTVWTDLSGRGNNGTLFDGPTFSDTDGRGSMVFDGLNDRVHVASPSDRFAWTPSGSGNNSLSIDMWVKSDDTDGGRFISKPWNGNGEYNYGIVHNGFVNQTGNQSHTLSFASLTTGTWQHICAVITPTQKIVYRNGVLNASENHSTTNNTPTNGNGNIALCIMSLYPYGAGWSGATTFSIPKNLSSVKVYSAALTASQAAQNFNALRGRFGI